MVCANKTGTYKLPLTVIGKSKNPRCLKEVRNIPVVYKSQNKGWMNFGLFAEWYEEVFIPNVKRY
jgi:hypothetical protein